MLLFTLFITLAMTAVTVFLVNWFFPLQTAALERNDILSVALILFLLFLIQAGIIYLLGRLAEHRLKKTIAKQQKQISAQREFVSLAAHQLRTPLSALKWSLDLLRKGETGELTKEQNEFVQKIEDANNHLVVLVNDLLNVSRIEEGRMIFKYEVTDAKQKTEEVIDLLNKSYHEKNLKVTAVYPDRPVKITADPIKLDIILSNILDNSYKYTSNNGSISVKMKTDGRRVDWVIKDSGIGIPKKQQPRLFEKFFRADNAVKTQTSGTGLGLYLVKQIIEHENGILKISSAENKGTEVSISLPINAPLSKN